MLVSIIAAIDKNRGLGRDGKMLINLVPDLAYFKDITSGHVIVMGRGTFESIGKPLPNRINVVLTQDKNFVADGCTVLYSIEEAIDFAKGTDEEEIFFIGGASIYAQSIKYADKLYLTLMDKTWPADTFFPEYDQFKNIVSQSEEQEHEGLKFKYIELTK